MKKQNFLQDYIKANRRGSRDAELENSSGWKSVNSIHVNKKKYSRKNKHRNDWLDAT